MTHRSHGTPPLLGSLLTSRVAQRTQRGFVKSVQTGTVTLAAVASNTATITAVSTANSILVHNGEKSDGSTVSNTSYQIRIILTNSTTVTGTSVGTATGGTTSTADFTVIEFYPGVLKSVQTGTIALSGSTSNTATIAAVNMAKSVCMQLGTSTNVDDNRQGMTSTVLTNSTTVTTSCNFGGAATAVYQVVEFF